MQPSISFLSVNRKAEKDMFAWLSSTYRLPPKQEDDIPAEDDLAGGQELPTAMKYRFLKNTAKDHVGVYRLVIVFSIFLDLTVI